ncbi:hypothetical protein B0H15DRAFT_239647 [Mycena belliarum]|uniref:F-box domain-containing protein n=1 Tax=Mycena belliarum TaxID=1033014 RepID=A0AAD6UAT1_9AGAR|nr:hypothetical protein B0H15DRAFT_239647 [Mycena belliae]
MVQSTFAPPYTAPKSTAYNTRCFIPSPALDCYSSRSDEGPLGPTTSDLNPCLQCGMSVGSLLHMHGGLLRDNDYISAIPPELLASIFQLAQCQDLEPEDDEDGEPAFISPALEVATSHVSVYWRNVALTTRLLWRHISISQRETVEKLRVYLSRSGQVPLYVRLDLVQAPGQPDALTEKVDLVFLHLARWGRFAIHSNIETSELPIVSRLYDALAPSLEHLSLCINDVDSVSLRSIRRADFEQILTKGCPRLSVLRLRGLSMHFFRPPLANITTLYLEQTRGIFIGYDRFKHLLTASPALAHLSIHDTIIDEDEDMWPPDSFGCIPVPNLVSLRISIPGTLQHIFSDILISISAPRLESLVLKEVGEAHLDRFFDLPDAASKFPALRALTFCDFDYHSVERLAKMCAALPSIRDFTCLHSTSYAPKILFMMANAAAVSIAGAPANPHPWPNLETLATTLDVKDLELARRAMECRRRLGYPLQLLRISDDVFESEYMEEEDEDHLDWLQDNMAVESFSGLGNWPPGSDYDPDDDLF